MVDIYCDGSSTNDKHDDSHAKWGIECNGKSYVRSGLGTNNQAEYKSLILALDYAYRHSSVGPFTVYTDSALIYYQMSGEWKIINDDIKELVEVAKRLRACISATTIGKVENYAMIKLIKSGANKAHYVLESYNPTFQGIEDIVDRLEEYEFDLSHKAQINEVMDQFDNITLGIDME